jgi:rifampicin phosphotransferase
VGAPAGMSRFPWPGRHSPKHRSRLASSDEFAAFAARYGHQTTARSETVKFVIDRLDADRTYFVDSQKLTTHYRFVQRYIDPRLDQDIFLRREYTHPQRRFVLGSLIHYIDGDHWTIELSSNDTMDGTMLAWMVEHIASRVAFGSRLQFRPVSAFQIDAAAAAGGRLPVLSREAINATMVYQPVVLGVAYGRLLRLRGQVDVTALRPYDVVVTDDVPNEIPPVAGLITSQLQAPLAHVAVLCRGRNTPDMAHRGAIDLPEFARLEGEVVKLSVGAQEYSIVRTDPAEAEAAWTQMRPVAVFTPRCDASVRAPAEIASLPDDSAHTVGSKAAQLAALSRIDGLVTPGGFVLPFAAYLEHLDAAGLGPEIDAMLSDPDFVREPARRAVRLRALRDRILAHPLDASLLAQVVDRVLAQDRNVAAVSGSAAAGWIVRSSSNAEDLAGFSGAGLYESTPVPPPVTPQRMADAIRSIWASVWLQRAFEEREWYRIAHREVAMAAIIQPLVSDAIASGVAITGNPFQRGEGLLINAQIAGHTVTGAAGDELPEQHLVTTWSGEYEFELLNKSSLTHAGLILEEPDLRRLSDQLFAIHTRLLPRSAATAANAMDVEFILTRRRGFVIVQARPYTIVYNADRADVEESKAADLMRKVRRIVARFVPNRLAYRPQDS